MKNFQTLFVCLLASSAFLLGAAAPSFARPFEAQVIRIEGKAHVTTAELEVKPLRENDSVKAGDFIEVDAGSYVDLALDWQWKNLARIEGGTGVTVVSVEPGRLKLRDGAVYAKLDGLPKGSAFELSSPIAVVAVRGSKFRLVSEPSGPAKVFNYAKSSVEVYGVDASGNRRANPATLREGQKSEISGPGADPAAPEEMTAEEKALGEELNSNLHRIQQAGQIGFGRPEETGPVEDPEAVLTEMARSYEAKDFSGFMARVSENYPNRGEFTEFIRRDFRDFDNLKLNLFIQRVNSHVNGATVQADWQLQYLPTATARQVEVRGSRLEFVFVNEAGHLKLHRMRGQNPLFGARSPEVAAAAGVPSGVARALETVEDTGNRAAKQTAMTLVGLPQEIPDSRVVPVGIQIIAAEGLNVATQTTTSLQGMIGPITLQLQLRVGSCRTRPTRTSPPSAWK